MLKHSKASAMFPNFILTPKHLVKEVKIELILKCGYQSHTRHGKIILFIVICISQFYQCMFLHVNIIFPHQCVHPFYLTYFQSVVNVFKFVRIHLKHLSEIAITKLFDCLEHVDVKCLVCCMLQNEFFWINFTDKFMLRPIFFLTFNRTIKDSLTLWAFL